MKRIAITGAAGNVGCSIRSELLARGYELLLVDIREIANCAKGEHSNVVDITDQVQLEKSIAGCDAVIHLASCTTDAPWAEQLHLSALGTICLFDAARAVGIKRIIYASSHHVVGLHPRPTSGSPIGVNVVLRPDSRYAVGKAFGESLAAMYAYKFGMEVMAIRIGNVNKRPLDRRRLGGWISERDFGQLVEVGIEHPNLVFSIVYGISDATGRHYDNKTAYDLGYVPQDGRSSETFEATIEIEDPAPRSGSDAANSAFELSLGGGFSQAEFLGDGRRIYL
jgi:uronate dehydrogenase